MQHTSPLWIGRAFLVLLSVLPGVLAQGRDAEAHARKYLGYARYQGSPEMTAQMLGSARRGMWQIEDTAAKEEILTAVETLEAEIDPRYTKRRATFVKIAEHVIAGAEPYIKDGCFQVAWTLLIPADQLDPRAVGAAIARLNRARRTREVSSETERLDVELSELYRAVIKVKAGELDSARKRILAADRRGKETLALMKKASAMLDGLAAADVRGGWFRRAESMRFIAARFWSRQDPGLGAKINAHFENRWVKESEEAIGKWLRDADEKLEARGWKTGKAEIQSPLLKGSPALLVSKGKLPETGMFGARLEIRSPDTRAGLAFAIKDEDNFHAVVLGRDGRHLTVQAVHVVDGQSNPLDSWQGKKRVEYDQSVLFTISRTGRTVRPSVDGHDFGDVELKSDGVGAFGFYIPDGSTGKRPVVFRHVSVIE